MGFPIPRPPKFGVVELPGLLSMISLDLWVSAKGLGDIATAVPGEIDLYALQGQLHEETWLSLQRPEGDCKI